MIHFNGFLNLHDTIRIGSQTWFHLKKRKGWTFRRLLGSQFHLASLQWIPMSLECFPMEAISMWILFSTVIKSVKIRPMTCPVPPGPFVCYGAVLLAVVVIIVVICGKLHVTTGKIGWEIKSSVIMHTTNLILLRKPAFLYFPLY